MKNLTRLMCIAVGVTVAGCAGGMNVTTDYDPAQITSINQYRTYDWFPPPESSDPRLNAETLQRQIASAVDAALIGKGYRRASGNPDFMIGWSAEVEGKAITRSYRSSTWRTDVTTSATTEWEEGTLILDVADAGSQRFVWRATAQAKIDPTVTPEERQQRLNEAAREMLESFPPGR